MIKILFVCHGNICRSPAAEYIFRQLAQARGCADRYEVASAAVSNEEEGNPVYPPMRAELAARGIRCNDKRARQLCAEDYAAYDLLLGMDGGNLRAMQRLFGGDPDGRVHCLLDYTARGGDISDPWYTRRFDVACRDIEDGCRGLLESLEQQSVV